MNKKLQVSLLGLLGVVLVFGAGYWLWQNKNHRAISSQELLQDPFARLRIPENTDPAVVPLFEEKIKLTKEMYQDKPNIWETWVAIGNLHSLLGDNEGALLAYQQSVNLQPNNIVAERNIADLYANHFHNYELAAAHYRAALRNEVNNVELFTNLVTIEWKELKNISAAESTLQEGLTRTGASDLVYLAAQFYKETGQPDKAKIYQEKIKTIKPAAEPLPAVLGVPNH